MEFNLITNFLEVKKLRNPNLDILVQDHNLYKTLLYQPNEKVEATEHQIRNVNRERSKEKFKGFFEIASKKNVELAVTPEYSCPWEVVSELIEENQFPEVGKLWIVGCESIRPNELKKVIDQSENIEWIYDSDILEKNIDRNGFFDPACYFFKTRSVNGELKNVITIQFKTHTMGGISLERDNLIRGETIYVLKNENESTRLLTLICSDSLNINNRDIYDGFINIPHILIHLQLNPSPSHPNIRPYRVNIYQMGWDDKEVLCLNWSRNIEMNNTLFNDVAGSAFYIQSEDLDISDNKLSNNHNLGLYYTSWSNRYAGAYFLNYDEHVYYLRNTKPSLRAVPPPNRRPGRTGPEMLEVKRWDNGWKDIKVVDDGFCTLCETIENNESVSLKPFKNEKLSSVDTERLVTLCIGEVDGRDWYNVKRMKFFKIEDDENVQRLTFTHHPNEDKRRSRKGYLRRCATLENLIIKDAQSFPESISDLKNNCSIQYRPKGYEEHFNLNLYPENEKAAPASVSFLSEKFDKQYALKLRDNLMDLFEDNQLEKRIVVWLRTRQGGLNTYSSDKKPSFKDNPSKSKRSIRKTE